MYPGTKIFSRVPKNKLNQVTLHNFMLVSEPEAPTTTENFSEEKIPHIKDELAKRMFSFKDFDDRYVQLGKQWVRHGCKMEMSVRDFLQSFHLLGSKKVDQVNRELKFLASREYTKRRHDGDHYGVKARRLEKHLSDILGDGFVMICLRHEEKMKLYHLVIEFDENYNLITTGNDGRHKEPDSSNDGKHKEPDSSNDGRHKESGTSSNDKRRRESGRSNNDKGLRVSGSSSDVWRQRDSGSSSNDKMHRKSGSSSNDKKLRESCSSNEVWRHESVGPEDIVWFYKK